MSDSVLNLASQAAAVVAEQLSSREFICVRRRAMAQPNLWWLQMSKDEDTRVTKATGDA
jgi:hypothetical protein